MLDILKNCREKLGESLDADLISDVSMILERDGDLCIFTATHFSTSCKLDIPFDAVDALPSFIDIIGDQLQVSNGRQTFSERIYEHLAA
jgi:hypothetical protein